MELREVVVVEEELGGVATVKLMTMAQLLVEVQVAEVEMDVMEQMERTEVMAVMGKVPPISLL